MLGKPSLKFINYTEQAKESYSLTAMWQNYQCHNFKLDERRSYTGTLRFTQFHKNALRIFWESKQNLFATKMYKEGFIKFDLWLEHYVIGSFYRGKHW